MKGRVEGEQRWSKGDAIGSEPMECVASVEKHAFTKSSTEY